MDVKTILKEYDAMYTVKTPHEIAEFLDFHVNQAEKQGKISVLLTLLNEQIGFSRETGMKEAGLKACQKLIGLVEDPNFIGTVSYGHSLLNIANAYRAFGYHDNAEKIFPEIETVYRQKLGEGAYEFAALYNNWSLLYMDMGNIHRAIDYLKKSIKVIDRYEHASIKQATSRVNLACALLALVDDEKEDYLDGEDYGLDQPNIDLRAARIEEAQKYIDDAIVLFEAKGGKDYHYSSAFSARADIHMMLARYQEAVDDYTRAMDIVKMYMGENANTNLIAKKIALAKELMT